MNVQSMSYTELLEARIVTDAEIAEAAHLLRENAKRLFYCETLESTEPFKDIGRLLEIRAKLVDALKIRIQPTPASKLFDGMQS